MISYIELDCIWTRKWNVKWKDCMDHLVDKYSSLGTERALVQ